MRYRRLLAHRLGPDQFLQDAYILRSMGRLAECQIWFSHIGDGISFTGVGLDGVSPRLDH